MEFGNQHLASSSDQTAAACECHVCGLQWPLSALCVPYCGFWKPIAKYFHGNFGIQYNQASFKVYLDYVRYLYQRLDPIPEQERFEAFVPNSRRGVQGSTSHCLGHNFAKMFDIQYENEKGGRGMVW
ncbi:hypothetical protein IFM89_020437 [Coptis chinensis]|uniref:Uncharacterized protein n=1 Tax=Coptis chinensis TaxID=261450 RepID=A0A835IXI9_9MAGN|nr:hypothetical protein IFM89_020437 [Coptis chinensis]